MKKETIGRILTEWDKVAAEFSIQKDKEARIAANIRIHALLLRPKVARGVREAVASVARQIEEHTDEQTVFVVGGKSRRVTEILLKHAVARFPEDHPVRRADNKRIRLNQKENRDMYATTATCCAGIIKLTGENRAIIFDDYINSGRKALYTLDNLHRLGKHDVYFVGFSGPDTFGGMYEYLLPATWPRDVEKVLIGLTDKDVGALIYGISHLYSGAVQVRLAQTINDNAGFIHLDDFPLDHIHSNEYKQAQNILNRLDKILSDEEKI